MVDKNKFTYTEINNCIDELDYTETIIRDILQYYKYFIRPEFKQKPDISEASERFKNMHDEKTVNKFLQTSGNKMKFKFQEEDEKLMDEDLLKYEEGEME